MPLIIKRRGRQSVCAIISLFLIVFPVSSPDQCLLILVSFLCSYYLYEMGLICMEHCEICNYAWLRMPIICFLATTCTRLQYWRIFLQTNSCRNCWATTKCKWRPRNKHLTCTSKITLYSIPLSKKNNTVIQFAWTENFLIRLHNLILVVTQFLIG